ncbi:MFS transporter [Microbacterium sp. NPDC089318]
MSLLALASGIFIAQTAEFLPGGLVPQISDDLAIDVGLVGQMVSVFAFTVVVATAPLTLLTRRIGRKTLVVCGLAALSTANIVVAAAPSFEVILIGRVVGALAHGVFWAVVATYAVEIAPREKLGRAMAFTAAGGSLAGILGIPIGNALGEAFGWRQAFVAIGAAGMLITVVLWRWLPRIDRQAPRPSEAVSSDGSRRRAWDRSLLGISMICLLILILVLGQTAFGPYTTVWLEAVAGLERGTVPLYLLITGVAGAVGAIIAGHLYDRFPRATFAVSSALLAAALCFFPTAAAFGFSTFLVVTAIISSLAFAGLPMMLQTRMMHTASPQMRRFAGALQTVVFNIAIGGGAVLGGVVVSDVGVHVLPWVAAAAAAATGIVALGWDAATDSRPSGSRQARRRAAASAQRPRLRVR